MHPTGHRFFCFPPPKTRQIMVKKLAIFFYFLGMIILLASAICSCRSTRYVPVETVRQDSVHYNKAVRDSIHVKDSVLVFVKGDTVKELRFKYVYREKERTDSAYTGRTDSIRVPYPVEARLTKWQQFKMDAGGYALASIAITILIIAGYMVYKSKK